MKAARKVVPIYIDCTEEVPPDLKDAYDVSGTPTILFVDGDGKVIEKLTSREPTDMVKQIEAIAKKYPLFGAWHDEISEAFKEATGETPKPVLLVFLDESEKSTKMLAALTHKSLKDYTGKFVRVRRDRDPDALKARKAELKKYNVSKLPSILILDPTAKKPEKRPLARVVGVKSAKVLKRNMDEALEKWKKARAKKD